MNKETEKKLFNIETEYLEIYNLAEGFKKAHPEYVQVPDLKVLDSCLNHVFNCFAAVYLKTKKEPNPIAANVREDISVLRKSVEYLEDAMEDIKSNCADYTPAVLNITKPLFKIANSLKEFASASSDKFISLTKAIELDLQWQEANNNPKLTSLTEDFTSKLAFYEVLKEDLGSITKDPHTQQLIETLDTMYNNCQNILISWNNGFFPNTNDLGYYWNTLNEDMSFDAIGNSILIASANQILNDKDYQDDNLQNFQEIQDFANESKEFFKDFITRFQDIVANKHKTNDTMTHN